MTVVLDASAVLSLAFGEPGAGIVAAGLAGAAICAINESEVLAIMIRRGATPAAADAALHDLGLSSIAFDRLLAARTARLERETRAAGLSLADRACLALAASLGAPVLTADRAWLGIANTVGVEVRLIR